MSILTLGRWGTFALLACGLTVACMDEVDRPADAEEQEVWTMPPPSRILPRGFTAVSSIRELPDGTVLIADVEEAALFLADFESGVVAQVSRRGEGPGEYLSVGRLYPYGEDGTVMTDARGQRWLILQGDSIVRTLTRTSTPDGGAAFYVQGAHLAGIDREGHVVGPMTPDDRRPESLLLKISDGLFSESPSRVDTLTELAQSTSSWETFQCSIGMEEDPCYYLRAEDQAVVFQDSWVGVARFNPYRVDWLPPGASRWRVGTPLGRLTVSTAKEQCAALHAWSDATEPGEPCDGPRVERFRWADTVPPFLALAGGCMYCDSGSLVASAMIPRVMGLPDGMLLVRRTPTTTDADTRYDVVGRDSRRQAIIALPTDQIIIGFGRESVFTVRKDETDLQWLGRHGQFGRGSG